MTIGLPSRPRPRTVILGVCAALLVWLVVSQSFAAYLAGVAPQAALWINSRQPDALVNLANQMLNGAEGANAPRPTTAEPSGERQPDAGDKAVAAGDAAAVTPKQHGAFSAFDIIGQKQSVDLAVVRAYAQASLLAEPLDARALRILGQVEDATKNEQGAADLMQAAARQSLHESIAVFWLMLKSLEMKDYKATIDDADILLRTVPEYGEYVVPLLARVAEDKASTGLLKTMLSSNPPWRADFFEKLPNSVTDGRIPLDLLLALRGTADPPTSKDINIYLNFLVGHKLYNLAYYTWLQFLPPAQLRSAGLLYNGTFETVPSGSPFDWEIVPGSGVAVDIEEPPDENGERVLALNFEYGRVEYHSVSELIMLAPGSYRFAGRYRGDLVGPRGLRWRVACAEDRTRPVAESEMIAGRTPAWRETDLNFVIPGQNCRAQYLSLDLDARMPSEQFITGSAWFGDLRISRLAGN
jgi:hypothetical protein